MSERLSAAGDLAEMGPLAGDALPALLKALESGDLALKHEVIIALGRIGEDSRSAVGPLTQLLKSNSTILRHSSIHALRLIGPAAKTALPRLVALMSNREPLLRVAAAWAVIGIAPDDRPLIDSAIPVLIDALGHTSEDIQSDAVIALAEIGKPAVGAIAAVIGTSNPTVCWHACDALAEMGPLAKPAVPKLVKMLTDEDTRVLACGTRTG